MNEESNGRGEWRPRAAGAPVAPTTIEARHRTTSGPGGDYYPAAGRRPYSAGAAAGLDIWTFLDAVGRHWMWLPLGGLLLAGAGVWAGIHIWKPSFTATTRLLHANAPHIIEVLGDRESAAETFASLLHSPDLIQRVATRAKPPITEAVLAKSVTVIPEHNSDVIDVNVSAQDPQAAIRLANFYAQEAVRFTQERQSNNAAEISEFVSQQMAPIETELALLTRKLTNRPPPVAAAQQAAVAAMPSQLVERLQLARVELAELLVRYKESYPAVREQRAKISAIQGQLTQPGTLFDTNSATGRAFASSNNPSFERPPGEANDTEFLNAKAAALESARLGLLSRKLAALTVQVHPPGECAVMAEATPQDVARHGLKKKTALLALFGGVLGVLVTAGLVLLVEALDPRLKTAADVTRVTRLPVLATAGNLERMTEVEKREWAFRAWTNLQGRLSPSPNHGFVCGFTSCEHGEGRSTWMRLLADAASQRGFRVLTIVARPNTHAANASNGHPSTAGDGGQAAAPSNGTAMLSSLFTTPAEVTEKLIGPNREPVVQIPLPGWVWDLDRRKQWQAALQHWSKIDNIALLAELPPASMPEAVLLAENLPNLIWLADARKATASKTREQLETLRRARCRLAGAVLNNAPVSLLRARLARWLPHPEDIPALEESA